MTPRMRAGLWAGLITASAMTVLLLVGEYLELFPPRMNLASMAVIVDPGKSPRLALAVGAVNHTAAGSLIGLLYGWMAPRHTPLTGITTLLMSWTVLMVAALPLTGHGLFGWRDGAALALWTLLLHILFGIILGLLVRARLARTAQADAPPPRIVSAACRDAS